MSVWLTDLNPISVCLYVRLARGLWASPRLRRLLDDRTAGPISSMRKFCQRPPDNERIKS